MLYYYLFTILCALIFILNKRGGFIVMVCGCVYFLTILPDTGADYAYYKEAFEGAYSISQFPWFKTDSILTSEPFYLWYSSFLGVILPYGFPVFLSINFLICFLISNFVFNTVKKEMLFYFWMMFLPVIFPTIFYFSPRSSISFIFILWAFFKISQKKHISAVLLLLTGCMFHSQFLLISFLIIITFVFLNKKVNDLRLSKRIIFYTSLVLFIILNFIDYLTAFLINILSFLPSAVIISSKMNYFEGGDISQGFRFTSILSILIYPIICYKILNTFHNSQVSLFYKENKNKETELLFINLSFAVIIYGAVINLVFFNEPHIAGRLSRFSDYLGMGIIIPLFLLKKTDSNLIRIILLILCVIAPIIFSTLYVNVDWNIL